MKNLLQRINEPFPERSTTQEFLLSLTGISLFIVLFLYFFRPFGLSVYPYSLFGVCLIFGLITFSTGLLIEFTGKYLLKIQKDVPSWTLGKWMIEVTLNILLIGVFNFLYVSYLMKWKRFNLEELFIMIFFTFALGLFPLIYSGMRIQLKALNHNQQQADRLQKNLHAPPKNEQEITLYSQNKSQSIQVMVYHLLYLEAMQNYVAIYHIAEEKLQKVLFRITLSQMEKQLTDTSLFRCHRSYMVNTGLIKKVAGNAQGLRLTLDNLPDLTIPVSRKYIPQLKPLIS